MWSASGRLAVVVVIQLVGPALSQPNLNIFNPPPGFIGTGNGGFRRPVSGSNRVTSPPAIFNPIRRPGSINRGPPPTRRPLFTRPPLTTPPPVNWDRIVLEAFARVNREENEMRRRLDNDYDRYARDFDSPDPLLFSESPENAEAFSRQSRIINWIARLRPSGTSVSDALNSQAASDYQLTCPFPAPLCLRGQRYRTIDGSCNNVRKPLWGAAFTPFIRYLPAKYESGSGRDDNPRSTSVNGEPLPNARDISVKFHQPSLPTGDDSRYSMLITIFAQFLAHDITDRAPTKGYQQSVMKCCKQGIPSPAGTCSNIDLPRPDEFRNFDRTRNCIEFPRSLEVTDVECETGQREQLNQASSFIDGGAIYGATKNKSDSLRRFKEGLMMVSVPQQLPIMPHHNAQVTMQGFAFYAAGDNRVNEFIGLMAMETVWLREHNRIAKALGGLKPHWNDEKVYQETRRIIVAIVQHITYSEYLPAILGEELVTKYELRHLISGHYTGYDPNVDPGLANGFATAAMRYGHSMLRTTYRLLNRENNDNGYTPIDLKDSFFRPQTFLLHEDPLMRGMATEASKLCDRVISKSAIQNLYETERGTGSDLAANNVQRGRDHGLPSYTQWRRHFGLSVPTRFDKTRAGFQNHDRDTVSRLSRLYRSPADVDLFTAGISEKPVRQGAVGPLFGNIIGKQFKALKKGDRYWYETGEQPQAFSLRQLQTIKTVTIARLLCNTYNFDKIQRRAFFNPGPANPLVPCGGIPALDLRMWLSEP